MSSHEPVTDAERPRLFERILACCVEEGRCLVWQRGCSSDALPVMSFRGRCRYVRSLMYEAHHGMGAPVGKLLAPRCRNPRCVSPDCIESVTVRALRRADARRGSYSRPTANAARLVLARKRATIPDDVVQRVRDFVGTCDQAAKATGVSLSHVKKIRAGTARKPLVSPWAGLMA